MNESICSQKDRRWQIKGVIIKHVGPAEGPYCRRQYIQDLYKSNDKVVIEVRNEVYSKLKP